MAQRSTGHKTKTNAGRSKTVRKVKKKTVKKKAVKRPSSPMANIHVKIGEPRMIRKTVLTLAVEAIEVLKKYESYHELQKQKIQKQDELRTVMREVHKLMFHLKNSDLPKMPSQMKEKKIVEKVEERLQELPEPMMEEMQLPEIKPLKKPKMPKITGIEAELADLKSKIATL